MKHHVVLTAVLMYATVALSPTADSPLVAAAKRGFEVRMRAAQEGRIVYTNDMVARSTRALSTSSGGAAIPAYVPSAYGATAAGPASAPERAPVGDAYAAQTASNPRLPQMSNNYGVNSTTPRAASATSSAPREVRP